MQQEQNYTELIDREVNQFYICVRERCISQLGREMNRRKVELFSLTTPQRLIVGTLAISYADQWICAKKIAESTQVDKGDVSRAVFALEQMGYLQTRTDPTDRRSRQAMVTQAGIDMINRGNRQFMDLLQGYFSTYLSQSEIKNFYECLSTVNSYWMKLQPEEYFKAE